MTELPDSPEHSGHPGSNTQPAELAAVAVPPAAKPGTSSQLRTWGARAKELRSDLERRPRVGFLLRSAKRFNEIEGKHLALVIASNLFISVIPLLILAYAFLEAFNPHRSFGVVLANAFHLDGSTRQTVENTFSNAKSGQTTALSISIISLLVTGFDVSATVQLAYARAFVVTPLRGVNKYVRGAAWLLVLLTLTGGSLALRYLASSRSAWFLVLIVPAWLLLQFGFFIVTPRLLLDLPFAWRDLAPGAAISTGAAVIVAAFSSYELHSWVRAYSQAYGGFGIGLSIIAYVGLLATFWVWVATVMGTYWAREAGTSKVAEMQELSAAGAPQPAS